MMSENERERDVLFYIKLFNNLVCDKNLKHSARDSEYVLKKKIISIKKNINLSDI